jgi:hypothetical protein
MDFVSSGCLSKGGPRPKGKRPLEVDRWCWAQADELKSAGVHKVWSVALAEPSAAAEWTKKVGIDGSKVRVPFPTAQ